MRFNGRLALGLLVAVAAAVAVARPPFGGSTADAATTTCRKAQGPFHDQKTLVLAIDANRNLPD